MQEFHQTQLIAAPTPAEFYRIHAFFYEMQTQAAGAHIVQVTAAKLTPIDADSAIFQYNLKSGSARPTMIRLYATEG